VGCRSKRGAHPKDRGRQRPRRGGRIAAGPAQEKGCTGCRNTAFREWNGKRYEVTVQGMDLNSKGRSIAP
jgi:hypothetical protein